MGYETESFCPNVIPAFSLLYSVLSVSFDSLAPARLTLWANLRLLYLKGPAFSIVDNSSSFGFQSPNASPRNDFAVHHFATSPAPESKRRRTDMTPRKDTHIFIDAGVDFARNVRLKE